MVSYGQMEKTMDFYESRDKQICPFLLIQPEVRFLGTRINRQIVYFRFHPKEECQQLVNAFISKKAPLAQPKDILDAVETFRDLIFEMKNEEKTYGTNRV